MSYKYDKKLTATSKALRKNMTPQERRLWYEFLKDLPVTVHRQKPIGNYIVDFYIASSKTAIELDGSQHYSRLGQAEDKKRDKELKALGITVLRYTNLEVNQNFMGVCEDIRNKIAFSCGEGGTAQP